LEKIILDLLEVLNGTQGRKEGYYKFPKTGGWVKKVFNSFGRVI